MVKNNPAKRFIKNYKTELTMLCIFIVFFIVMSIASEHFLSSQNMLNVVSQVASNAMMSIGMTIVIITGGIDLSVGGILGLSGMIGSIWMVKTDSPIVGFLVIMIVATVCGCINGFLIGFINMPAFIATLGTMNICRSLDYVISDANTQSGFPEGYKFIGKMKIGGVIPNYLVFMIVMFAIFIFILQKTKFGRYLYACGSNADSAMLSGINVKKTICFSYIISGIMCGFAAWIMTSRMMACDPTYGNGSEMDAIAAAVIGGTSMSGGRGTLWGTIIGVFLVGFLRNALNLLGVNPYWQGSALGAVIIIAVLAERISNMKNKD
jgi:ribose/xylose/arabinose/galactoside ABC-type transport system permease subunit